MCQACYDKGYKDYPKYDSAVAHVEDYKRGYKAKQNESLDAGELQHTFFCENCYERGLNNSKNGIWAPPLSTKRGHYESYEKGYNQVEVEEENKIPEYYLPEEEKNKNEKPNTLNYGMVIKIAMGILVLAIAGFFIYRFNNTANINTITTTTTPSIIADTVTRPLESASLQDSSTKKTDDKSNNQPAEVNDIKDSTQVTKAGQTFPSSGSKTKNDDKKHTEPELKQNQQNITKLLTDDNKFPDATQKVFTESDLKGFNKQELKLMRNEIFARHGYVFKSNDLNSYFKQKSWYKAEHENVNSLLSPVERQNVELIKKLEH